MLPHLTFGVATRITRSTPRNRSSMLPFAKMNGAGNAILVVDERGHVPVVTGEMARLTGAGRLGFDQMMVLSDAARPGVDATVRIYNTDGSRAGACGNGTRCVAWVMLETSDADRVVVDVDGQDLPCRRHSPTTFTVDMGPPRLDWRDIPLREAADTRAVDLGPDLRRFGLQPPMAVSMGNPHAVFFVPSARDIDLAQAGAHFEHHSMFPDRANIGFAEVEARDRILLRVWERGAGATLACGSAACAALVAAARSGRTVRHAEIELPGGTLTVEWREADDHVLMTGPVELEERGSLETAALVAA